MNQILTDEEIKNIDPDRLAENYARAIEAAILSKLNSAEPVAKIDYKAPYGIAFTLEGSKIKDGTKLFTHPPAPSAVEEQPAFVVELPDGDDREIKVWWIEKRNDGKWHISATVSAARSEEWISRVN